MKFKIAIITAILSINGTSFAMQKDTCRMPSAEVIRERFQGFEEFLEQTNLVEQLAGQEKPPLAVAVVVDTALLDYNKYIIAQELSAPMLSIIQDQNQMNRSFFIELLLQDYPEGLIELEKFRLYKRTKNKRVNASALRSQKLIARGEIIKAKGSTSSGKCIVC